MIKSDLDLKTLVKLINNENDCIDLTVLQTMLSHNDNMLLFCICSDNADRTQSCQGSCQHTSCSACRFVDEPDCQKCKLDDFRCMRQFAKCVKRKSYCTRHKFPCRRYSNVSYFMAN